MSARSYLSIGDVLTLLRHEFPDVTISKIRFLESQGLVNPERTPSGYRKFYEHDVERLRWVLRQQRENFLPLKVIKDRLDDEHSSSAEDIADLEAIPAPKAPPEAEPVLVGQRSASARAQAGGARTSRPSVPSGSGTGHPEGPTLPGIEPATAEANGTTTPAVPPAPRRATAASPTQRVPAAPSAPGASPVAPPAASVAPSPERGVADPPSLPPDSAPPRRARAQAPGPREHRPSGPAPAPTATATGPDQRPHGGGAAGSAGSGPAAAPGQPVPPRQGVRPGGPLPSGRSQAAAPTPTPPAVALRSGTSLSIEELAAASGLEVAVLRDLVEYGLLVETKVAGLPCFGEEGLAVATLAAGFARFGVEPRHLRLYKNAADREAGFVEQIVLPLVRQRNPEARARAGETADDLARLGQQLRAALLRRALGDLLNG